MELWVRIRLAYHITRTCEVVCVAVSVLAQCVWVRLHNAALCIHYSYCVRSAERSCDACAVVLVCVYMLPLAVRVTR